MSCHVNSQIPDIFRLNFAGDVRHNVTGLKYPDLTKLLMLQNNIYFIYFHIEIPSGSPGKKILLIVLIKLIGGVDVVEFYEVKQFYKKKISQVLEPNNYLSRVRATNQSLLFWL